MAIGDLLGGLLGGNAGKSEMQKATQLQKDAIARLEAVGIPTVEAQRIALETPELVDAAEEYLMQQQQGISLDPRFQQARMQAVEGLAGIVNQGGLGAEDRMSFNQVRRDAAGQGQAAINTLLQQDPALAQGGASGASLALRMQAGQNTADRMSQEGDRLAAAAAQNRQAGLERLSNQYGQMSTQKADIDKSNQSTKLMIDQFNKQLKNQNAQTYASNRQAIANQGTATRNQQEIMNKALIPQQFQMQLAKATGTNQATGNLANTYAQQGQAAAQGQANMTTGLLGTATRLGVAALGRPSSGVSGGTTGGNVVDSSGSVNSLFDMNQMKADAFGKKST